jgi:hypothetical protein
MFLPLQRCYGFLQALQSCQQHEQALACGAATLLGNAPHHGMGISTSTRGAAEQEDRLPLLYDAPALQLWLLKCCQAVSGGPAMCALNLVTCPAQPSAVSGSLSARPPSDAP